MHHSAVSFTISSWIANISNFVTPPTRQRILALFRCEGDHWTEADSFIRHTKYDDSMSHQYQFHIAFSMLAHTLKFCTAHASSTVSVFIDSMQLSTYP